MFKKVLPYGAIHEDDQLIYFNVAYAMAAQLYNSPKGTMKELFSEVEMLRLLRKPECIVYGDHRHSDDFLRLKF